MFEVLFMPWTAVPWDARKGHGIGVGVRGGCEPPGVVLGTVCLVLEEQCVLFKILTLKFSDDF